MLCYPNVTFTPILRFIKKGNKIFGNSYPFNTRMTQYLRKGRLCFLAAIASFAVNAQFTKANDDPDAILNWQRSFTRKHNLALLYPLFKLLYAENRTNSSIPVSIQSESKYYSIICLL